MGKDWTRRELEEEIVGEMTATTIPVNVSFDGKQRFLDMGEEVEAILRRAEVIVQHECGCRERVGNCI
jgi:hypothetical protein